MRKMARGRLASDPNGRPFNLLLGTKRRRGSRWLAVERNSADSFGRSAGLLVLAPLAWFPDADR
jgi:hypothetical protein